MSEHITGSLPEDVCGLTKQTLIRVLYVDDDACLLTTAKQILELQGPFQVDSASSVKEAYEKMKQKEYDVIVSDFQMPIKDGLQFLKELRESGNNVSFILFTGKGREDVAIRALNLGVDRYINKNGKPETVYGELGYAITQVAKQGKAEKTLVESEEKFRLYVETSPIAVFIADEAGRYKYVNDAACKLLGYSREELLEMSIPQVAFTSGDPTDLRAFEEVKKIGKSLNEQALKCKNGMPVYVILNAIKLPDGKLIAFCENITERKKAENQLRKKQKQLEAIVLNAPVGIATSDSKMIFNSANDAFCRILGFSEDELKKLTFKDITHPDDIKESNELMQQLISGHVKFFGQEKRYIKKDGTIIFGKITVSAVRNKEDKPELFIAELEDITERKKLESNLLGQNELLKSTIESLTYPFFVINASDYTIRLGNKASGFETYKKQFCYEASHKQNKPCTNEHSCPLEIVKKTMKPVVTEHIHIDKNGNKRNVEVHGYPIFDKDGNVVQMIEYTLDITKRKNAEKEIQSLAKFPSENPNPVLRVNKDGTLLFSNKAAEKLISEQKIDEKQHIVEIFHQSILECLSSGLPKTVEVALEDKTFSVMFNPIIDEGYVNIYGIDITQLKKVEKMLRASEERFRGVFEEAMNGILAVDLENQRFVFANPRICEITGYTLEELLKIGVSDIHSNDDLPFVMEQFTKQVSGKISLARDIPVLRKDQQVIYCDVNSQIMNIGEKRCLVGFFRDSTERRDAEKALNNAFDRLALVNEKLGVVGRVTRHDVRNKLSVAMNNIYLAKQVVPPDSEVAKYLDETESAFDQIERIFDVTRTYEQLGVEEMSIVDVGKSFDAAVALLADLGKIEVVNECKDLSVLADSLLDALFYNLIDNTIRHGEKVNQIRIHHKTSKDSLKLIYEDDGVGIPEAEKELIFNEGYGKNTGLGLAMIKKMCNVYGWTIQETGTPQKGAQFTIIIPARAMKD